MDRRLGVLFFCLALSLVVIVCFFLAEKPDAASVQEQESVLFVGDVFLGRQTEERIAVHGVSFPFVFVKDVIKSSAYAVMNFESAIAIPHVKTPYYTFQFSTRETTARSLADVGFTHFGLANNHAYDFESEGYSRAYSVLSEIGEVFGEPYTLSSSTVSVLEVNNMRVALIGLYAVDSTPHAADVKTLMTSVTGVSDTQVVFIHWGKEYELTHSKQQAEFARALVAHGADLIIGHHPHVVQDIELYQGVPIVYSLGNFVFDQYFSKDVQEGLMVRYQPGKNMLELLPVTTHDQPMQPRMMTDKERDGFLSSLADRSDEVLQEDIRTGIIRW